MGADAATAKPRPSDVFFGGKNRAVPLALPRAPGCVSTSIRELGQPFVAGVYPMLLDETCFFLAVDFDKSGWLEDSTAFIETCRRMDLSAALERSRSGRGGHAWLFFEEAVPAALARKLGCYILTETMERRPDIGFDSYDRFFPNQDTLPHGGFGNLIALPLQKHRRGDGNSVFLDDHGIPHHASSSTTTASRITINGPSFQRYGVFDADISKMSCAKPSNEAVSSA